MLGDADQFMLLLHYCVVGTRPLQTEGVHEVLIEVPIPESVDDDVDGRVHHQEEGANTCEEMNPVRPVEHLTIEKVLESSRKSQLRTL